MAVNLNLEDSSITEILVTGTSVSMRGTTWNDEDLTLVFADPLYFEDRGLIGGDLSHIVVIEDAEAVENACKRAEEDPVRFSLMEMYGAWSDEPLFRIVASSVSHRGCTSPQWRHTWGDDSIHWIEPGGERLATEPPAVGQVALISIPDDLPTPTEPVWALFEPALAVANGWCECPEELSRSAFVQGRVVPPDAPEGELAPLSVELSRRLCGFRVDAVLLFSEIPDRRPPFPWTRSPSRSASTVRPQSPRCAPPVR